MLTGDIIAVGKKSDDLRVLLKSADELLLILSSLLGTNRVIYRVNFCDTFILASPPVGGIILKTVQH